MKTSTDKYRWKAEYLTRGSVLRYLRVEGFRPDGRTASLSQAELYELCTEAEERLSQAKNLLRFKPQKDIKSAEKKIRRLENDDPGLIPYVYEIAALAMGFPASFLDGSFENLTEVENAVTGTLPGSALESLFINFPGTGAYDYIAASRVELLSRLEKAIFRDTPKPLVVVEGASMVGKTHLLGQWARRPREKLVVALRLDCAGLSMDQIVPEMDILVEALPPHARRGTFAMFLDGLRIETFKEGPNGLGGPTGKKPPLQDLLSAVTQLRNRFASVVTIVMENNFSTLAVSDFSATLPRDAELVHLVINPLRAPESVEFLRASTKRTTLPPEWLLIALADQLQGMPLALAVAAEEMRRLSDSEITNYLQHITDIPAGMTASVSRQFIQRALDRIRDAAAPGSEPENSHPLAFMRLLALMPLPVEKALIQELASSNKIERLTAQINIEEMARGLPFVRETGGA